MFTLDDSYYNDSSTRSTLLFRFEYRAQNLRQGIIMKTSFETRVS